MKRLKVRWELTDRDIREYWDTPECEAVRQQLTLNILEDECKDDPDSSRLERLKEIWLIKTEIKL